MGARKRAVLSSPVAVVVGWRGGGGGPPPPPRPDCSICGGGRAATRPGTLWHSWLVQVGAPATCAGTVVILRGCSMENPTGRGLHQKLRCHRAGSRARAVTAFLGDPSATGELRGCLRKPMGLMYPCDTSDRRVCCGFVLSFGLVTERLRASQRKHSSYVWCTRTSMLRETITKPSYI